MLNSPTISEERRESRCFSDNDNQESSIFWQELHLFPRKSRPVAQFFGCFSFRTNRRRGFRHSQPYIWKNSSPITKAQAKWSSFTLANDYMFIHISYPFLHVHLPRLDVFTFSRSWRFCRSWEKERQKWRCFFWLLQHPPTFKPQSL